MMHLQLETSDHIIAPDVGKLAPHKMLFCRHHIRNDPIIMLEFATVTTPAFCVASTLAKPVSYIDLGMDG